MQPALDEKRGSWLATIWIQSGSNNSSGNFLLTPKVAASAVECQSVTVKRDLDTVEVGLQCSFVRRQKRQALFPVCPLPGIDRQHTMDTTYSFRRPYTVRFRAASASAQGWCWRD